MEGGDPPQRQRQSGSASNVRKSKASRRKTPRPTLASQTQTNSEASGPQFRPLLTVQSSFAKIPESTYRPSKALQPIEKGYSFCSKGTPTKDGFFIIDQISLNAYICIKGQSAAKYYARIEPMGSSGAPKQLKREVLILQDASLKSMDENRRHFLKIEGRGRIVDRNINYVIVPFCEQSLDGRRFSHQDALRLTVQCFQAVHDLHVLGYVHRNLKPNVFCLQGMGGGSEVKLYLTSFWYSYRFRKGDGPESRSPKFLYKMKKSRFMPRSYYLCKEITRADDLESWLYIAVFLIQPAYLNWNNTMADLAILSMKERFFCVDSDVEPFTVLPKDIHAIVKYLQKADDRPNYPFLGMLLAEMIKKENVPINGTFDFQSSKYAEPKAIQPSVAKKKSRKPKKERTKECTSMMPPGAPKPEPNEEEFHPPIMKAASQQRKRRPKQPQPSLPIEEDPFEGDAGGGGPEDAQPAAPTPVKSRQSMLKPVTAQPQPAKPKKQPAAVERPDDGDKPTQQPASGGDEDDKSSSDRKDAASPPAAAAPPPTSTPAANKVPKPKGEEAKDE